MVSPSRGLPIDLLTAALASSRPVCHWIQQVVSICVTGTRPLCTGSHLGLSGGEFVGLPMQENHCDCSSGYSAMAPTLNKSLKADKSLCPVRALNYFLDKTSDLRQNKDLVFVSFKRL